MTLNEAVKIVHKAIDNAYRRCLIRCIISDYIKNILLKEYNDIEDFKVIPKSEGEYDIFIRPKCDIHEIRLTFDVTGYDE
jgi:hypothetical protein